MRRAPILRRVAAAVLDSILPVAATATSALLVGELNYSPPAGWFLSEWLLKIWLDAPGQILIPAVVLVGSFLLWQLIWESLRGRTPGAALLGLEVVDEWGDPIEWPRAARRFVGGLVSVASLGLGWCWIWVDPEGRGWPDRLAGSWVVLDDERADDRNA